jgi:capsular polysaccharide transport system permease protein
MTTLLKRTVSQQWLDVVFALFVREIRTKFNDKLGISWAVVSPLIFIFMLSFMRGRMNGGDTWGMPTFAFMAYGMIMIQMFLGVLQTTISSIQRNKALMAFRQVQPISAVVASAVFSLLVNLFVVVSIVGLMFLIGINIELADPLTYILNFSLLWLLAVSIGLIISIFSCFIPEIKELFSLVTRPMFFISGVFFSLNDVHLEYRKYLDWNPVLHMIELSRHAAYPGYPAETVSQSYSFQICVFFLFLALAVYHSYWKQAISR